MANVAIRSFAGGELAPVLHARTDLAKYQNGLRTCRNMIVLRNGGAANRAGTAYVANTKADGAVRLVPFIFETGSVSNVYVLEFGDRYVRFHQDGAPVLDGPDPYEVATPYLAADLDGLQVVQSADVVTIVHPSYAPRELRRTGHTDWTLALITFGPAIGTPTVNTPTGGVAGDTTYYAVTAVDEVTGEESLAGYTSITNFEPDAATPIVVTWETVQGADEYRIYRSTDGTTYGYIGVVGGVQLPGSDTSWTTTTATATTNTSDIAVLSPDQARNPVVAAVEDKAYDGVYTVAGTVEVTASGTAPRTAGRAAIYYSRDGEARVFAGYSSYTDDVGNGTFGPYAFTQAIVVPDNGYTTLTLDVVAEVYGVDDAVTPTFTAVVTGTSITWQKGALTYSDTNGAADFETAPPTQGNVFAVAGAYPSAVGYYQQRRVFAASTNQPETVRASRTGSHASFAVSVPLQDDDPVTFTLAGRYVSGVRHLRDLGALVVGTTNGWYLVEGDEAGILTPASVNPRKIAPHGTGSLPPLEVNESLVYQQARGSSVRDLRAEAVSSDGYSGSDLTVYASHLFDGYTLDDWAYAEAPQSTIFAVRSDGTLLGFTYLREHAVWAWHRHDTAGAFENVCVVPEGAEDRLYCVVRRTIDGATVRFIERMASRTLTDATDPAADLYFVDAGATYDGRNTGATTCTLTDIAGDGGDVWTGALTVSCVASASTFAASHVGDQVWLEDPDGDWLVCDIEAFTGATQVEVRVTRTVPAALRETATTDWALAVDTLAGLDHLEGEAVSVLGDGYVLASPNNSDYAAVTVTGGQITLSQPVAVAHVGLPYTSDLETLDLDTPGGASLKTTKLHVSKVTALVERTRGLWWGQMAPEAQRTDGGADAGGRTVGNALYRLEEARVRESEAYRDPVALLTGEVDCELQSTSNRHGRVFVRQVDPLPATILAVIPQGTL